MDICLFFIRSRRSVRSGYAFAHQEGFGRLITSGKIMRPNPLTVHPHHHNRTRPSPQPHHPNQVPAATTTIGHAGGGGGAAAAAAGLVNSSITQVVSGAGGGGGGGGGSKRRKTNQDDSVNQIALTSMPPQLTVSVNSGGVSVVYSFTTKSNKGVIIGLEILGYCKKKIRKQMHAATAGCK